MAVSRKAVATAFSTANMRAQFPNIRTACAQLVVVLKSVGPDEVVDIDNALCRESLDVIGAPHDALQSKDSDVAISLVVDCDNCHAVAAIPHTLHGRQVAVLQNK